MKERDTLRDKRQRAGRIGGLTTFLRYGADGMSERGRKGGRPRLPVVRQLSASSGINMTGGAATEGVVASERGDRSLTALKKLWMRQVRSSLAIDIDTETQVGLV